MVSLTSGLCYYYFCISIDARLQFLLNSHFFVSVDLVQASLLKSRIQFVQVVALLLLVLRASLISISCKFK